jgi:hypothetical protein
MKMTPGKSNGSDAKEPVAFRPSRSRVSKKRRALFGTKEFWRAISSAALSSPHTPVLRRLHD